MLREILRKMSRDDSKVRLKALEDVLQLGNSIAEAEAIDRNNGKPSRHYSDVGPTKPGWDRRPAVGGPQFPVGRIQDRVRVPD